MCSVAIAVSPMVSEVPFTKRVVPLWRNDETVMETPSSMYCGRHMCMDVRWCLRSCDC